MPNISARHKINKDLVMTDEKKYILVVTVICTETYRMASVGRNLGPPFLGSRFHAMFTIRVVHLDNKAMRPPYVF
jgi:hypothetical protein